MSNDLQKEIERCVKAAEGFARQSDAAYERGAVLKGQRFFRYSVFCYQRAEQLMRNGGGYYPTTAVAS
jgi:hypothetical protein